MIGSNSRCRPLVESITVAGEYMNGSETVRNLGLVDSICMAHCSQFEHSGDSTMQSSQCVTVHPVPKFRSCHKAIMVITGRAHCYTFCIFRSLLMQFEHSFGLGGESLC